MFAMLLNNQRVNHGIARCPLASHQDEHIAKHENPIKTIPETNHLGVMSSCFIIPNTDWVYPNMIQKLTHSPQCYIWGWFIKYGLLISVYLTLLLLIYRSDSGVSEN